MDSALAPSRSPLVSRDHSNGHTVAVHADAPPADAETRQELTNAAHKRFGSIPAELIVEHVLAVTPESDFSVREAALHALVRRMSFAERDGLAVASTPPGGAALGAYLTRRSGPVTA